MNQRVLQLFTVIVVLGLLVLVWIAVTYFILLIYKTNPHIATDRLVASAVSLLIVILLIYTLGVIAILVLETVYAG